MQLSVQQLQLLLVHAVLQQGFRLFRVHADSARGLALGHDEGVGAFVRVRGAGRVGGALGTTGVHELAFENVVSAFELLGEPKRSRVGSGQGDGQQGQKKALQSQDGPWLSEMCLCAGT